MKNKTLILNSVYALSMLLIIIMRILFSTGVFSGLSDTGSDAVWDVLVQIISMGIIPFSLLLIYYKKSKVDKPVRSMLKDFGYGGKVSLKGWVFVLLISVLSTYVITCLSSVWYSFITLIGYKPSISSGELPYTAAMLIFEIFFTACLPAVFEEFSNRGIFYHGNENREKPFRIIVFSAAMFALMHTNVTQVFYTFAFGLVCGGLVYCTKSIWPAILAHFINNLVAVMKTYGRLNGNGLSFLSKMYNWLLGDVVGGTVATVLFIVIVIIMFFLFVFLRDTESTRRLNLDQGECDDGEVPEKHNKYERLPIVFAASMNVIVTVFTLVWGIVR